MRVITPVGDPPVTSCSSTLAISTAWYPRYQSTRRIQACPFIPVRDRIRGFVYDVKTGRLNEVT